MAIQVNGTTVIDNNRNFTNIAGGFKTVNGTSVVGSGNISAGASTTYNTVGTYCYAMHYGSTRIIEGSTYAGSNLKPAASNVVVGGSMVPDYTATSHGIWGGSALSGTWRAMGRNNNSASNSYRFTLFVRIS